MGFLIDTSALIDVIINRQGSKAIRSFVQDKEFFISAITVYELNKASTLDPQFEPLLLNSNILNLTPEHAKQASKLFKKLKETGSLANEMDIIIAGTAIQEDLILITKDRGFERMRDVVKELKVQVF